MIDGELPARPGDAGRPQASAPNTRKTLSLRSWNYRIADWPRGAVQANTKHTSSTRKKGGYPPLN